MIKEFLNQDTELEAFITGPAGSGKTTYLAEVVDELDKMRINYQVVAYTHKAKDVLISKLPDGTPISTLHSWLKKRPGINEKAEHIKSLVTSKQYGKPEHLQLLIVDEFSFVDEKDYYSIGELQDEFQLESALEVEVTECCEAPIKDGKCSVCGMIPDGVIDIIPDGVEIPKPIKVLYVGDLNQLSPIDGPSAVQPHEPFWIKLDHIYRQEDGSGLQKPLSDLIDMIAGKKPMEYLQPTEDFIRGVDIVYEYKNAMEEITNPTTMMLAWTNEAVQSLNAKVQGRKFPQSGDRVNNFTMKEEFTWYCTRNLEDNMELYTVNGIITKDTKYNPFKEFRKHKDIIYVQTLQGLIIPCIFGVYNNKIIRNKLGLTLTSLNKDKSSSESARKNAYKAYKMVSDYVSIVDFTHCKTIHTSQGQECDRVYIDSKDLSKNRNPKDRLKLLYVGMSRARSKIYLNN